MPWSRAVARALVPVLLASGAVAAEPPPTFPLRDDPALSALVEEALGRHPDLVAARERVAAARARAIQAGAPPEPEISIDGEREGATGLGVSIAQEIPLRGTRGLARSAEDKEAGRLEHMAMRVRLRITYDVRKAYADLLLAGENLALIEDQRRATRAIEELTRTRYAVGLADQPDVLRAQAELARLDQMQAHEEGEVTRAVAALNRLLARPAETPAPPIPRLSELLAGPVPVPPREAVLASLADHGPDMGAAGAEVERNQALLALARRQKVPDLMASAGYLRRGAGEPDMWTASLGVRIPLWAGRRQKQAVVEAEALLRAAEAERESARLAVRATAERNLAEFAAAVKEAAAYTRGVLVIDALAVESALASYRAGKVPFVSVLEAHNTLYRDRWEHVELLFHVLWHSAALDAYGMSEME